MKKTKFILSMLVSFLLAFVTVFAVACDNGSDDVEAPEEIPNVQPAPEVPDKPAGDLGITDSSQETLALQFLEIVQVGKTEFDLGEEYSSADLSVRAVLLNPDKQQTPDNPQANLERRPLTAEDYTIDSSDYNADRVGTYTIYLSYTFGGITATAYYMVTVRAAEPAIGGIVAELADGKDNTYALTADATSVTIPKDILAVYTLEAGENGKAVKSAEPLNPEEYTAQLYLGSKLIEKNEATENGTYSLVATLEKDPTKQDFISVYVTNPVTGIELVAGKGTFTQTKSVKDEMSSTWQFTVTYANGVTKTVKAGDAGLSIVLDTNTVGAGTAAVTYIESGITVTCEVNFTIKEKQQSGSTTYSVAYDVDAPDGSTFGWTTTWANNVEDTEQVVKFNASALTNGKTGTKKTEDGSLTVEYSYEFKSGKELNITVGEEASDVTITYYVSHGTSNDSSRTATVTKGGETVASVTPQAGEGVSPNLYIMTVENATAGTYVLTANNTMRVYLVEITYTVNYGEGGGSETVDPIEFRPETGTLNAGALLVENDVMSAYLSPNSEVPSYTVDASAKATSEGGSLTNRLKFGGGIAKAKDEDANRVKNAIVIETTVACKVTFYVRSSNGSQARLFQHYTFDEATGTLTPVVAGMENNVNPGTDNDVVYVLQFELEAGTYYFGSASSGVGVYGFDVAFN